MDIVKIGVLGIVGILMALMVKEMKPQYAILISIATCIVIFYYAVSRLEAVAAIFSGLREFITVQEPYLEILLKIVGISYIADFSANICKDAGYSAVAGQIEIFGKIAILTASTPVVLALLRTVSDFLE